MLPILVRWKRIVFFGGLLCTVASLQGCEIYLGVDREFERTGATTLNPQEGILVLGRTDTLRGGVSTTWPMHAKGNYIVGPFLIKATYVPDRTYQSEIFPHIGFSASPSRHSGYITPTEGSEWKMWLDDNDPPQPGTYRITIGARVFESENPFIGFRRVQRMDKPYIPGKEFRLFVLAEESFVMRVDANSDYQVQGTVSTRTVHVVSPPGFTDPILLELVQPPPEITATFDPFIGNYSVMHLTVGNIAPIRYSLQVKATGGGLTKTASFIVDVLAPQYIVRLTPDTLWIPPGQTGQATVNVAGTFLPATLSSPNEPNVSITYSRNPTGDTSTLAISVDPLAQMGIRRIPITGTFSNNHTASDTLTLNIASSAQWRTVFTQNGVLLFGLGFENSSTGFGMAVTQSAASSTDGGRSWNFVNAPPSQANDVAVVGPLHAIAVGGNNKIMRTNDGGISWVERPSGLSSADFYSIAFSPSDPNLGIAVGRYGVITRTTNSGEDWVAVSLENTNSPHGYDVSLYGSTGTIVGASSFGSNASILRTTDSGLSWSSQTPGTTSKLNGVSFTNENSGFAVGNDATILRTVDGGAQWVSLTSPIQAILEDVSMHNSQEATAVGSGGTILQTSDGGQTWVRQSVPILARSATLWKVFVFPDNSAICLGNEFGCIILRRESAAMQTRSSDQQPGQFMKRR